MDKIDQSVGACLPEIQSFSLFQGQTKESLQSLCLGASIEVNSHREECFVLGESASHFGLVLSGAYKLVRVSSEGTETILYFATPGDLVGTLVMNKAKPTYPVTSVAMGPSRMLKIPRSTYIERWLAYPQLILEIQSALSQRMSQLQMQKSMLKAPLSVKVAQLLIEISERESKSSETNYLPLPITRREIAESLGASVESVIRVMSDWSKNKIIETKDQRINLLRFDKLLEEGQKLE